MKELSYEDAQARMPAGWLLWGNMGDGMWRAGIGHQDSRIKPSATIAEALERALRHPSV